MNFLTTTYNFVLQYIDGDTYVYKRFDNYEIRVNEVEDVCIILFNNINMFNEYQQVVLFKGVVLEESEYTTIMSLVKP